MKEEINCDSKDSPKKIILLILFWDGGGGGKGCYGGIKIK